MNTKLLWLSVLVVAILAAGAYFFPQVKSAFGSATGATFTSAKVAEIVMAPISSTATSSSILNTDGSARIVDTGFVSCATSTGAVMGSTGAGVATWTWQMATTSVANQGLQGNTNYAMNMTVGTSTTDNSYAASTTNPALVGNRLWPAGTYLTINTNATTTNNLTATCQAGVYYHGT